MIGKNNPLNIRYSSKNKWLGQIGQSRGFCDFESLDYCFRVGAYLIMRSYRKRGLTDVRSIISAYAPVSENDTEKYIKNVCRNEFIYDTTEIDTLDKVCSLLQCIAFYESGFRVLTSWIKLVIKDFNIKFYEKK